MNKILIITIFLLIPAISKSQTTGVYNRNFVYPLLQNQDYEKAVAYLLASEPADNKIFYYLDLGYSYYMLENFSESQKIYSQAYNLDTANVQANLYLATIYNRMRLPELALGHYKRLAGLYPDVYRYWHYAASAAEAVKEYDSAYRFISKSYALKPQSAPVTFQYAEALQKRKQTDSAEYVINRFLALDSSSEMIISKKIDISFNKNKNSEVIFWGERLWEKNAQTPSAFTKLLFSYLRTDKFDKCIQLYNWLDAANMNNESVKYGAALAYAAKKDFLKSNELLNECIKNNLIKEATIYLRAKADNLEKMKDYKKAVAYYDTSYYIFQQPIDLYYAGFVHERYLNDAKKATALYKRYLQVTRPPKTDTERSVLKYIREFLNPASKK